MKKRIVHTASLAILCLLLSFALPLHAQVEARFTADKTGGCSPLTVNFTNTSTGTTSNTQYVWDFGNGNTSTLQHPGVVFTAEKTYSVKLTVINGSQSSTESMNITVYGKPVVDFTADITRGCLPLAVNLTAAASQAGSATIASYHWDFGDGYAREVPTAAVVHTYETKQPVTVSLTVKNNYGCHTTLVKKDIIEVLPLMRADFESDKKVLCQVSDPVQFTNKSVGPGTLTYLWDFGNGQTSTAANPAPVMNTRGTYTVKLTVNSSAGCTATKTQADYLNVANYTTDIQMPALVCKDGVADFKALCTPVADALAWEIDGVQQVSTNKELQAPFYSEGTHGIKLKATYGSCQQEITRSFTVHGLPSAPEFEAIYNNVCGGGPVTFKDTSTDAVQWEWNFNYQYWQYPEIINATTKEATNTYTPNVYSVSLKSYNAAGCFKRVVKQISLLPPAAEIIRKGDNPWGHKVDCDPAAVSFKATSLVTIVKYKWIFDIGAATSTDAEPSYTFAGPGYHYAKLEFETDKGCKGEAFYLYDISVRTKPVANFESVTPTTVCGNTKAMFRSTGTGSSSTSEVWKVNGAFANTSWYNTFEWQFSEKGKHTIQLISGDIGCQDTMTKADYVEVLPPFPKITRYEYSCDDRSKVTIYHNSRYAEKTIWDFGDGNTTTLTTDHPSISHSYSNTGKYRIRLATINGQCTTRDSLIGEITIQLKTNPILSSPQTAICGNEPLSFTLNNVPDPWNGGISQSHIYQWQYGDGTISSASLDHWIDIITPVPFTEKLYNLDPTKQNIRVILKNYPSGCPDTSNYIPLVVRGSIAGYELLNNEACFNTPLQIRDTSRTSTGGTIRKWDWDFGDGQQLTTFQSSTVTHKYDNPGTYNIVLRVTDDVGCVSSPLQTMQTARVNGPKAVFTASGTVVPLNSTVNFTNTTNDFSHYRATYLWDFGNGQTGTGTNAQQTYPIAGKYIVQLTATDPVTGCRSIATQEITVENINAHFSFTKSYIGQNNCLPLLASFATTTLNTDSLSWDFGDGTTAGDVKFPKHTYDKPGKYIIILTAYGPHTSIQYKDSIIINTPQVTLSANVWEGCPGYAVNWNVSGVNTTGYIWDFGDGNTGAGQNGTTTHPYVLPGTYSPTLLLKDANGCLTAAGINNKVIIHPNPTIQVAPATGAACLGQPMQLKATGAATYAWSPAAGLSDPNSDQPVASPQQTTTYYIDATDIHGCKSSKAYTLTIHQPFSVELDAEAKLCTGDKLTLRASGADRYNWINHTAGLSNLQSNAPVANPVATSTYTVVGYDNNGCFTDTAEVIVTVNPRPAVDAGQDVEVQVGASVQLSATGDPNVIRWNWSPPGFLSCTDCSSPVCTPQSDMKYTVSATNQFECSASDEVVVKLLCDESRIRIPNIFTPNGDRKNDRFVVKGISLIKHLVIYNRWGNKVFERQNFLTADESACWDGTLNGIPQPTGTYVYLVEMQCPKGETFARKGTVMIVR